MPDSRKIAGLLRLLLILILGIFVISEKLMDYQDTVKTSGNYTLQSNNSHSGNCLSEPLKEELDDSWAVEKESLNKYFNTELSSGNPYGLYFVQVYTNNLLDETGMCQDSARLNELVILYNSSYQYLTVTPDGNHEWICGDACPYPEYYGKEDLLCSQQFMFLISRTLHIISDVNEQEKTPEMKVFVKNFGQLANESYTRWQPETVDQIQRRLKVGLADAGPEDAIRDRDLWVAAGIVELLAAEKKETTIKIPTQKRALLLDCVHKMSLLLQSRLTATSLQNFKGAVVKGTILDYGVLKNDPENQYACYTGTTFPTPAQTCTAKTGWDISHGRRFVQVLNTLHDNRDITGDTFPDDEFMTQMANELVYGSSNRNVQKPLFTNYFGGMNGWYRVGYHGTDFGYPPYGLTEDVPLGGYGFWAKYNSDIGVMMQALLNLSASEDPFILQYYHWDLQSDRGKIQFLPTFARG